ncbi:VOC family protein [Vibrio tetraodonis]|uniref:VOC family protein n=1 Tax=Vibrio tetraodonis TaxID=2231647 RepID=UPI0030B81A65
MGNNNGNKKLGHINIVVEDIDEASKYYCSLLKGTPVQRFDHFRFDEGHTDIG